MHFSDRGSFTSNKLYPNRAIEVDHMKMPRAHRFMFDGPKGQRSDPDPPSGIGRQVIEPDGKIGHFRRQKRGHARAVKALEDDVAAADDQPAIRVRRDTADTAALGDHGRDR